MTRNKFNLILMLLALGGVMFSGYLSAVKFFSGVCAFGESCPIFFGKPACYFGLAIFAALFLVNLYGWLTKNKRPCHMKYNVVVSGFGIIYAGYMLFLEVQQWGFKLYGLGLPTCLYGTLFFLGIFIFTLVAWKKISDVPAAPATPIVPVAK